jgi:thiazole synthase
MPVQEYAGRTNGTTPSAFDDAQPPAGAASDAAMGADSARILAPLRDNPAMTTPRTHDDPLVIAGKPYASRLLTGTGKFRDLDETRRATEAAGAQIVTVAIRRTNIGQQPGEPNLLDVLPPDRYTILPNTAGCYTAEDAVRTCRLARELLDGHALTKLEVLGDQKTLYPDVVQTLKAAEQLVADGFQVMVYTSDDPILCKRLEEIGCVAVMPLAAPIGSGLGIQNRYNLLEIIENAKVPIIVDAGVGTASDAAIAMELGCDGVLMNTAIAGAKDPVRMARAMKLAVEAGRDAFLAGRIPRKRYASASSPVDGLIG